jgi:hypothetical protein
MTTKKYKGDCHDRDHNNVNSRSPSGMTTRKTTAAAKTSAAATATEIEPEWVAGS